MSRILGACQLDPPEKPNFIAFPIYQDKGSFEKKGRRCIDQLPNSAAALIESLQPFQRNGTPESGTPDQDALVLLQSLSNSDKHRVPSVVLLAPTDLKHSFSPVFYSEEDASAIANGPIDTKIWAGPLQPGVVLLELRTNKPIESVSGKCEGHAIVAIQSPIESVAVAPTLKALHQYTALVISQFESFFK